ncbi:hypothetical protein [Variovorax sp. GB1P17]|uniref:hypothetical protein n=1 Tax=Variovorax sp. GB1P17 TaxID=3443740 RepID=UPI003F4604D6
MGEFAKRVRANKIQGPLRKGFNPQAWASALEDCGNQPEDQRLHAAGLEINKKLSTIRANLKISTNNDLNATTKVRALVACSNHDYRILSDRTPEVLEAATAKQVENGDGEPVLMHKLMATKVRLPGGASYSPDAVAEGLVDGLQVPLRVILEEDPKLSGNLQVSLDWREAMFELNLGLLYLLAEDLWNDCVWNGYELQVEEGLRKFRPTKPRWQARYAMGRARGRNLAVEFMKQALDAQSQFPPFEKAFRPVVEDVKRIEKMGRRQQLVLTKTEDSSEEHKYLLALRAYATEDYYEDLLAMPRKELAGLTLADAMNAWTIISRCSDLLLGAVKQRHQYTKDDEEDDGSSWLPAYVPTLQRDALIEGFMQGGNVSRAGAIALLEFMTYRGRQGQELWAQPLVPVGQQTLTPVFGAAQSPNLRRIVDIWLRQLGIDLALRGPAFEKHIRAKVAESIEQSPKLAAVSQCLDKSFSFTAPGEQTEEVDVVFSIGRLLFLCELKCILDPTEPKAIAMHRETLTAAAAQITRKAAAANKHKGEIRKTLGRAGFLLPENFEICTLVVTNGATQTGMPIDGVPIVDELIIDKFFAGELVDARLEDHEGNVLKETKTIFYTDEETAQEGAQYYFLNPQAMVFLRQGIKVAWYPLHPVTDDDWAGAFAMVECVPKLPAHVEAEVFGAAAQEPN